MEPRQQKHLRPAFTPGWPEDFHMEDGTVASITTITETIDRRAHLPFYASVITFHNTRHDQISQFIHHDWYEPSENSAIVITGLARRNFGVEPMREVAQMLRKRHQTSLGTGLVALEAFLRDVVTIIGNLRGGIFQLRNRMYLAAWGYRHLLDPLDEPPPMFQNFAWGALQVKIEHQPFILPNHEVAYNGGAMQEPACPICLADWEFGDWVGQTDCLHIFHTFCLITSAKANPICPMCRTKFYF